MAQHDQLIANDAGANVRADINNALAALFGLSSGPSAPSTTIAYQLWADTTNDLLKMRNAANTAWITVGRLSALGANLMNHGQCRLAKSGANLVLSPYGGRNLIINGEVQQVPAGGVSLAASGLTPFTVYFIYAYMNAGVMTLEASATTHVTDSTTGVEVKSGDASRTLVGMAVCDTGPAWVDTEAKRYVLSYFNRRTIIGRNWFTTLRGTASTTPAEIFSEIRCSFISWADEAVHAHAAGSMYNDTAGGSAMAAIGIDGSTLNSGSAYGYSSVANAQVPIGLAGTKAGLTEAATHYATLIAAAVSLGTAYYLGAADGSDRTQMTVMIRG